VGLGAQEQFCYVSILISESIDRTITLADWEMLEIKK